MRGRGVPQCPEEICEQGEILAVATGSIGSFGKRGGADIEYHSCSMRARLNQIFDQDDDDNDRGALLVISSSSLLSNTNDTCHNRPCYHRATIIHISRHAGRTNNPLRWTSCAGSAAAAAATLYAESTLTQTPGRSRYQGYGRRSNGGRHLKCIACNEPLTTLGICKPTGTVTVASKARLSSHVGRRR